MKLNEFFVICRQTFASGEQYNEQGSLKSVVNPEDGQEREVIVTKGSYTIIEKDGSTVLVNYTADENGFHPEIGKFYINKLQSTKCTKYQALIVFFFLSFISVTGSPAGK